MPVVYDSYNKVDKVAVFQIGSEDFLHHDNTNTGTTALKNFSLRKIKQKEACLKLVSLYAGQSKEVNYDSYGKPYLVNDNRHISFSHSNEFAAMMLSEKDAGIDFELIRPKVINIMHKFLNQPELNSLSEVNTVEHAHVYWGAKESIYKVYGKQQVLFKEHILLEPISYLESTGYFNATLKIQDLERNFTLFYKKMFGYMLVHIVNEI